MAGHPPRTAHSKKKSAYVSRHSMVCSSIIGACLRATALTHTLLTHVPRTDYNIRLQPWSICAAPDDLFPDAEGAPEGNCTHVIMAIFAAPHDLFPDAEGARFVICFLFLFH